MLKIPDSNRQVWKDILLTFCWLLGFSRETEAIRYIYIHILLLFSCSVVSDSFVTPWTVARQAPLSMGFPRQEFWSGLPFHSPGDRPYSVIKSTSSVWQPDSFTTESPGKPYIYTVYIPAFQRPVVQEHRGREAVSVPAQQSGKEQIPLSSAFFFFSSPQELGWTPPTMGHQLHSAPQFKY